MSYLWRNSIILSCQWVEEITKGETDRLEYMKINTVEITKGWELTRKICLSLGDSGLLIITHKVIFKVYENVIKILVYKCRNM